jgi:S1-C subfamily serine protease
MLTSNRALKIASALLLGLIVILSTGIIQAQVQQKMMRISGGENAIFMLNELGALLVDGEDGLSVMMVLPPDQRAKDYQSVDMKEGDIIKMFNGKRVENAKQLKDAYNALKVGAELKFGISRGRDMKIEKLIKADEKDLPQSKMIIMGPPDDGIDGVLIDAGIFLNDVDGKITIVDVNPTMSGVFGENTPMKGDVILKIQGQSLTTPETLKEIYGAAENNSQVKLTLLRGDEELISTFTKPSSCTMQKKIIKNDPE